jgi:hypothetical protein
MLLEKIDAQKKSFTLRFSDTDVISVAFGADKWGYNEMRVEVSKKEPGEEPNIPDTMTERFAISYHWNPEMEETPAFVMDMMSLLHKLGKVKAEIEELEEVEEAAEEIEEADEETEE